MRRIIWICENCAKDREVLTLGGAEVPDKCGECGADIIRARDSWAVYERRTDCSTPKTISCPTSKTSGIVSVRVMLLPG